MPLEGFVGFLDFLTKQKIQLILKDSKRPSVIVSIMGLLSENKIKTGWVPSRLLIGIFIEGGVK